MKSCSIAALVVVTLKQVGKMLPIKICSVPQQNNSVSAQHHHTGTAGTNPH